MSWEPGVVKFGDGYYEFPRDTFDPKEYFRIQEDYLLQHTEVTSLAAIFIARLARKSMKNVNVLKKAGLFFTRPANVLTHEVNQELKRKGKLGFKPDIMEKHQSTPLRRSKRDEPGPCPCPTICTPSVESIYSDFVSESTSATTLPSEEIKGILTPTVEEIMEQFVVKALNTGLNTMYAARERDIVYDEAYLCLINSIQKVVEAKWNPVINDIKGYIDTIIDNVKQIATQRHRSFATSEEHTPLTRKQVLKTMKERQGTYNRYPKDALGVYISSWDESFDGSVTNEPPEILKDESSFEKPLGC